MLVREEKEAKQLQKTIFQVEIKIEAQKKEKEQDEEEAKGEDSSGGRERTTVRWKRRRRRKGQQRSEVLRRETLGSGGQPERWSTKMLGSLKGQYVFISKVGGR